MRKHFQHFTLAMLFVLPGIVCSAQTELEIQSSNRPMNLDITGPVYQAGSNEASADFQENSLPGMLDFIDQNLNETQSLNDVSGVSLDPAKLYLNTVADVQVYFLGEGAGYHNTLGFTTDGIGLEGTNPELIFPDASSYDSWYTEGNTTQGYRSESYPLLPGDYVDLGTMDAATQLDFFLIANGANGGRDVYTAHDQYNPDGIQHVVSYALEGSPYLIIGFEDLYGGGDQDYNDLVFAVDIGYRNVQTLANPEPATWMTLGLVLGLIFLFKRRQSATVKP